MAFWAVVVDDESHIVEIVRDYLKQVGCQVLTVLNGQMTGMTG